MKGRRHMPVGVRTIWTIEIVLDAARWLHAREPFSSSSTYDYCGRCLLHGNRGRPITRYNGVSLWYALLGTGLVYKAGKNPKRRGAFLWKVDVQRMNESGLELRTTNPERLSCLEICRKVRARAETDEERLLVDLIVQRIEERGD